MYNSIASVKKVVLSLILLSTTFMFACGDDKETDTPTPMPVPAKTASKITVDPATTYQEMIGFGGALTWYSDRVVSSSKSNELYKLMFEDLGMDILRLKNWYYPLNYPENKSPETMLTAGDKTMFNATNTFYQKAKQYNPDIDILLSSWGPPPALKSNNHLREGTLKKDADGFMYDEFATYWSDVLDNIAFAPDYISIQNEPGYTNPGWTTAKWAPTETSTLAGYSEAFDAVYDKIKDRPDVPIMIGGETENIQAFLNFAPVVKTKAHAPIYGYHPYNFNSSTQISQTTAPLTELHTRFGDKPNIMTEYSTMPWFKTARFIHQTMKYAHSSGYIYWELVWGDPNSKDQAMIYVDGSGNYTINPFYYVIKHFSKFIDEGYQRVEVTSTTTALEVTGYMHPDQNQLTLVIINPESRDLKYQVEVENRVVKTLKGYQSMEGNFFKDLGNVSPSDEVSIPASSITTLVLNL
ncbi:glycoside hydrolase family 30 beta sandwich domain-containing protein [Pontibacter toksunensis]|uniref:Glycoside hydrolase family 30 beta sandwich domain-containing protein n=1 Tax=Pontibacter toksunensis TaxID=1332631 RepID=A0ABW6BZ51_9BACT